MLGGCNPCSAKEGDKTNELTVLGDTPRNPSGLYSVTYKIRDEVKMDTYKKFMAMTPDDDKNDCGPEITLIGRYHCLGSGSGICIAKTDSIDALNAWVLNWGEVTSIDICPVTNDEETRTILNSKLGEAA